MKNKRGKRGYEIGLSFGEGLWFFVFSDNYLLNSNGRTTVELVNSEGLTIGRSKGATIKEVVNELLAGYDDDVEVDEIIRLAGDVNTTVKNFEGWQVMVNRQLQGGNF